MTAWDDWDDLDYPGPTPKAREVREPKEFVIRLCGKGLHELRGDNLQVVRRSNGATENRCRACHNRRQREFHERQREAKR